MEHTMMRGRIVDSKLHVAATRMVRSEGGYNPKPAFEAISPRGSRGAPGTAAGVPVHSETNASRNEQGVSPFGLTPCLFGGARRDRTVDLYNAIVALSQLSYGPENRAGGREV